MPSALTDLSFTYAGALAQVQAPAGGGGGAPAPAAPAAGGSGGGGGSPAGGGAGGITPLLFPILIFAAFYFFFIRPQQKKAKDLESKLKKGDRVFTNAGIFGTIIVLKDKRATLEIAKGVQIEVRRDAIGGIDEGDDAKPAAKDDDKKSDKKDDAKVADSKK
jgi:preprotein translocase subunit YajC